MKRIFLWLFLILIVSVGVGCVNSGSSSRQFTTQEAALPLMERMASNAHQCWFKSASADFKPYRFAPELNSFSGRPRFLLVPYNEPTARPLLVVEASGNPAQLNVYGALMTTKTGKQIEQDLARWVKSSSSC